MLTTQHLPFLLTLVISLTTPVLSAQETVSCSSENGEAPEHGCHIDPYG